ncbi:MAG: alpha/beta hydrolase, partial [Verrucomicrobia bacterium]|nr:alpha/beta hydrolase [Verrucomicrobiota bacterium]
MIEDMPSIPTSPIKPARKGSLKKQEATETVAKSSGIVPKEAKGSSEHQGTIKSSKLPLYDNIVHTIQGLLEDGGIISKEEVVKDPKTGYLTFSRRNKIDKALTRFSELLTNVLIVQMSRGFFPLYYANVQNKALQQKYSKDEKEKFEKEYGCDDKKIKATLDVLYQDKAANKEKIKCIKELSSLTKFESLNAKGEKTREALVGIGGERLALQTHDGAKLDGVFLSASNFRQKLIEAGGETITITGPDGVSMKGIAFDWGPWREDTGSHIISDLKVPGELTPVRYVPQDGSPAKVVLLPTKFLPETGSYSEWVEWQHGRNIYEIRPKTVSVELQEISKESKGGTVILSQGLGGVYEQYKDEATAFLLQGMDVVLFNYRGTGLSKGVPSDKKYEEDLETVYQFTKKHTCQEDSKILFKGLCFGGGPSAHAAGKHHDTNLFLDQAFSSFRGLVEEQVNKILSEDVEDLRTRFGPEVTPQFISKVKEWLPQNMAPIVAKCAVILAPDFEVAENLAKNRGKKALLYVHDDPFIPFHNVEKNIIAANKGGDALKVIASTGDHASKWIDDLKGVSLHRMEQEINAKYQRLLKEKKREHEEQVQELKN